MPLAAALLLLLAPQDPGRLVVLNKAEASASLLDLATGAERARLPVGVGPHEVAVSPDGRIAAVANYGGAVPGSSLTILDLAAERPVRTLDLGQAARPHGILFDPDGAHLWVTAEQRKSLLRVRLADGQTVAEIPTPQPVGHMVARDANGVLYVSHIGGGGVTPVLPRTDVHEPNAPTKAWSAGEFAATGEGAEGLAVAPDGAALWVGNRAADTLTILEPRTLKTLGTLPAAGFPIRVAFTPDARTALVSCAQAGALRFYDARERKETGALDFAAQVRADRAGGRLLDEFGDSPVPIGIVVSPDGARAYVALANADRIAEVDLQTRAVARWLKAGREPDGMAWYPGR
jgi:DNA-binding beta-propeller fold protein YncE